MLYLQHKQDATRELAHCARAGPEIENYPSLPEFPYPYPQGYPQFPPSGHFKPGGQMSSAASAGACEWGGLLSRSIIRDTIGTKSHEAPGSGIGATVPITPNE